MNLAEAARRLAQDLDQRMSPSVYDAAWLLRMRGPDGEPVHPDLLPWLLEQQHPDGSWGARVRYFHHDRMVCTLSAAIAIAKLGADAAAGAALRSAEDFLWRYAHRIFRDSAFEEPVGFELLFPALLDEARETGLEVPDHGYGMTALREEKLALIPPEMLFSRSTSIVHSLEFLGRDAAVDDLAGSVFDNGSLGNSPAATAYYLQAGMREGCEHPRSSAAYLERLLKRYERPVYLFPFRRFESLWVQGTLALADRSAGRRSTSFLDDLEAALVNRGGIALDDEFGIPDADCTAVACWLLALDGRAVGPAPLRQFEIPGEGLFRTYAFERNVSVSTNIHALEAVRLMPDYPNREQVFGAIETMLYRSRMFNLFWTDKWHASPYYATAHALDALLSGAGSLPSGCRDSVAWLVHDQRRDGSWGFFDRGTAEETAYALLALLGAYRFEVVPLEVLQRGADYLWAHGGLDDPGRAYTPLWLGKCLYAPYDIIRAAILAALIRYERVVGI